MWVLRELCSKAVPRRLSLKSRHSGRGLGSPGELTIRPGSEVGAVVPLPCPEEAE